MKVAAHEMGHALGFGESNFLPTLATIMKQIEALSQLVDLDWLPLGPTCGDVAGLGFQDTFTGPPQAGPDPNECGPNAYSDLAGCCHPLPPLWAIESSTGQGHYRPIVHITAPASSVSATAPAQFLAEAHALDMDGSISRMDWRIDGVVVRTQTPGQNGPPWNLNVSIASARSAPYVIDVVAYDYVGYKVSDPILVNVSGPPPATSVLASGGILYANQYRTSPSGAYYLIYQTDGNLVLYGPSGAIIATMTFGSPGGTYMNPNGNLEVYYAGPVLGWQSGTASAANSGAELRVLDTGRVALVRPGGVVIGQWP